MDGVTNSVETRQYNCQKCKKTIGINVYLCEVCDATYHPGCAKIHKMRNPRGEYINCYGSFKTIQLKQTEMDNRHNDETQQELNGACEQTTTGDNDACSKNKRIREDEDMCDRDANDEEKLRQLIRSSISAEVRPLIKKIDALQKEIIESKNEIISLKQIIDKLTNDNTLLQKYNNNVQNDSDNVASVSYANIVQKKNAEAVLVVKPVNADVTTQGNVNKNENLKSVKSNINVKELGVGVKSIKEKNNGTVVVKFKNVNDKDKLQKNVVDKIGDQFKVQAPKVQKRFVKIVYIDNEETTLTDEQLVNDIIQQNNLRECCEKIEMKIVKRIINDKKNDFSVIVEVNLELQRILLFLEKVSLGWKQCKVIEHVNIIRCFKCCGYNHYANECKKEITCGKCGDAHSSKDCQSTALKCMNCAHKNKKKNNKDSINDDKHNAFDKKCPIYIKLAENRKKKDEENN